MARIEPVEQSRAGGGTRAPLAQTQRDDILKPYDAGRGRATSGGALKKREEKGEP